MLSAEPGQGVRGGIVAAVADRIYFTWATLRTWPDAAVIAGAGSSAGLVQRVLDFDARSRALLVLRKVAGVLVLMGGLYLIYRLNSPEAKWRRFS